MLFASPLAWRGLDLLCDISRMGDFSVDADMCVGRSESLEKCPGGSARFAGGCAWDLRHVVNIRDFPAERLYLDICLRSLFGKDGP
jgi:hypothetical protein